MQLVCFFFLIIFMCFMLYGYYKTCNRCFHEGRKACLGRLTCSSNPYMQNIFIFKAECWHRGWLDAYAEIKSNER